MKVSLFQGILLGFFVLSAIIGVFVFAGYQGGESENEVGPVVIWGSLPSAAVNAALTVAQQQDDGLKNVSYLSKNPNTLRTELVGAIAQGIGPDLILMSHEDLHALLKLIDPIPVTMLPERTFKDTFAGGSEIFLAKDGSGAYGLPFLIDPLVLFFNRAILSSSGVALPPATWEAMTGLVSPVTSKTSTGNITGNINRGLIALGSYSNVHNARGILSALFLQAGVPITSVSANGVRQADLGVASSKGQAVLRFYMQFADPAKLSYTWNASLPNSRSFFLSGDLALYLGYASEVQYLRDANPNLDFDASTLPQLAASANKTTYGLVYAFSIPRGSKNPVGAYKAAVALTSPIPEQAVAITLNTAPAIRALLASPPPDPHLAIAYSSALYTKTWLSPLAPDTDAAFSSMIVNVTSNRLSLETALANTESILSSLIRQ